MTARTWSTSPASTWSSAWRNRAANAFRAARARCRCIELLTKMLERRATLKDLESLEELCDMVKHTSLCGLGPDRAEPGHQHPALFPQRIPRAAPARARDGNLTRPKRRANSYGCKNPHHRRQGSQRARKATPSSQAATDAGIDIPTLCHLDGLGDVGACRLCLVEVAGTNKLLPACVTKVAEGMEVKTDTERLRKYRLMILELLFAERNHVCSVCVANGHCDLQNLAAEPGDDARPLSLPLSRSVGRRIARAVRGRSQSLHPLHALRARLRRNRRRAHLGRDGPRARTRGSSPI